MSRPCLLFYFWTFRCVFSNNRSYGFPQLCRFVSSLRRLSAISASLLRYILTTFFVFFPLVFKPTRSLILPFLVFHLIMESSMIPKRRVFKVFYWIFIWCLVTVNWLKVFAVFMDSSLFINQHTKIVSRTNFTLTGIGLKNISEYCR